mmetsp:Transcript_16004/g.32176  ORF Transcript_16004/g.32176 Transcript_16004/m.32176 type:complete len:134 (-) Transcript_16004:1014-1415(-)
MTVKGLQTPNQATLPSVDQRLTRSSKLVSAGAVNNVGVPKTHSSPSFVPSAAPLTKKPGPRLVQNAPKTIRSTQPMVSSTPVTDGGNLNAQVSDNSPTNTIHVDSKAKNASSVKVRTPVRAFTSISTHPPSLY